MKRKSSKKKKIKNLKSLDQIPKFKTEDEEAEFWDSHSAAELIVKGLLEDVKVEITGDLRKKVEEHKKKQLISLRLNPRQVQKAKEIAIKKGIGYLTLMRNWIQEGIERELDNRNRIESSIKPLIEQVKKIEDLLKELENKSQLLSLRVRHLPQDPSFARIIDFSNRDVSVIRGKSATFSNLPFENPLGVLRGRVMQQDLH